MAEAVGGLVETVARQHTSMHLARGPIGDERAGVQQLWERKSPAGDFGPSTIMAA